MLAFRKIFLIATLILFATISFNAIGSDVNSANFNQKVIQASNKHTVFVVFTASWCRPCQAYVSNAQSAKAGTNAKVLVADVGSDDSLAKRYGIRSIPLMLAFKNGKVVQKFNQSQTASSFKQAFQSASGGSAGSSRPKVRVVNNTGASLCYHPMGGSAGSCNSRRINVFKLPMKVTRSGRQLKTRQLMIAAGGSWTVTVPEQRWTTYKGMTFCAVRTFKHKSGTVDWVVNSSTGIQKGCQPSGYRQ